MRRRGTLAVAVTALVFVGTAAPFNRHPALTETARWLAQRKVEVHCQTGQESRNDPVILDGAVGYVKGRTMKGRWRPGKAAVLKHGLCESLLTKDADPVQQALAVLALTHESGHLRGHRWSADEAKTECWAIRHFRYVAIHLGLDANKLYPHAWRFHKTLPEQYHLPGCVVPSVSAHATP